MQEGGAPVARNTALCSRSVGGSAPSRPAGSGPGRSPGSAAIVRCRLPCPVGSRSPRRLS